MLFKFRYPKLVILVLSIILAYFLFSNEFVHNLISNLESFGYMGAFVAGLFFSFGFTTPFATGFFISLELENLILAAMLGGIGALIADLLIFKLIKLSFQDEFNFLKKEKYFKKVISILDKNPLKRIHVYLMYAFAGIIIASPLPDEAGITLLAGLTQIRLPILIIISLIFNTLGILILLLI